MSLTAKRIVFLIVLIAGIIVYFIPGFIQQGLHKGDDPVLFYMGEKYNGTAFYSNERLYLPYDFIKKYIDNNIRWDKDKKLLIITTKKDVLHYPVGQKEGLLNLEFYEFTYPAFVFDETIYLPADPIKDYYDIAIMELKEQRIVSVYDTAVPLQQGIALRDCKVRKESSFRTPWTGRLLKNDIVSIFKEDGGYYWVETEQGQIGFVHKNNIKLTEVKNTSTIEHKYLTWNYSSPLMLTWEYVSRTAPAKSSSPDTMNAVNILSPTWFELMEGGLILNNADKRYVDDAHAMGQQVWALFSNGFNKELTHTFLNDAELRIKAIKQLLNYVELYHLDGINIDFENLYLKDKDAFIQFVRELTPLLHKKERVISVDVTFISKSENWSLCYDRAKLAEIVDYLMVMAYDEHSRNSSSAGSVSSLPWVERGIQNILTEVDAHKIILGIPFYTRLWKEEPDTDGKITVSSEVLSMQKAEEWVQQNKLSLKEDESSGQNYAEMKQGKATYRLWIEDEVSLEKRIEIMQKYHLAGIAAWRKGFEKEDIWTTLKEFTRKRI